MSEDILANVVRAGSFSPIAENIMFQFDKLNVQEAVTYQGSDPHFTYKVITDNLPMNNPLLLLFRDHVIDQFVIDPITNSNRKYLIVNDPEFHVVDGHWEFVCTRVRGT